MTQSLGVPGFRACGVRCGVKEAGLDLALIACDGVANAAGVFTRSTVVGAPVELSRAHLRRGGIRGVVVNSGCANVAMGERGRRDAERMAADAARALRCRPDEILVASTGVIGEPLPIAKIGRGIRDAGGRLDAGGWSSAARAIMTTDTVPKQAHRSVRIGGRDVTLVGIAKGAGMIEPNMATLLGFLATDAAIQKPLLGRMLREAVDPSFNRVSVDGEGSTSDSVVVLAGGAAENTPLRAMTSRGARPFAAALRELCEELARAIARDGEGATKLVTVVVEGAANGAQAERAARRIANSMLVKTALFGGDPNWGRILQTVGAERIALRLERAEVHLEGVPVFRRGRAIGPAGRRKAEAALRGPEIEIRVALGVGRGRAQMWTCDLSYDYIRINAEYHT
jgi:glutamate N-acetyltransferase/amino-acid N-acetyltransferase